MSEVILLIGTGEDPVNQERLILLSVGEEVHVVMGGSVPGIR